VGQVVTGSEERAALRFALIELCYERGFAELTPDLLCRRAATSPAGFASLYEDLEDCFCETLEVLREDFFAYLDRSLAIAEPAGWVERLRAIAYGLLRYLRADRRRTHFLAIELHLAGERPTLIWTETILRPLLDRIDEGRLDPASSGRPSPGTAAAIGGTVFTRIHVAAEDGSLFAATDIVPQMMYLAALPYLGEEAARAELSAPAPPDPGF
jgi:AcrR family transcriptional regulator